MGQTALNLTRQTARHMKLDYDQLLSDDLFGHDVAQKDAIQRQWLEELNEHHEANCPPYAKLANHLGHGFPLPVRLFKEFDLRSIGSDEVAKTMTSSGTTGQSVSRIYLDKSTSARQTKALANTVAAYIGRKRLPLLVIDSKAVLKNRNMFSARGAGILGFSMLGRDVTYALDENMELDLDALEVFEQKYAGQQVLVFGFTYIIFSHFCLQLKKLKRHMALDGYMIHGGGWKKLAEIAVDSNQFKAEVTDACGITHIHDYYGMVEQAGSIYMECECGNLHTSHYNNVRIVDPSTFVEVTGKPGLIVSISLLPTSYPGHILLTEDMGLLLGEDDCPCGRMGRYFSVLGRIPGAELRGCSDTYERKQ